MVTAQFATHVLDSLAGDRHKWRNHLSRRRIPSILLRIFHTVQSPKTHQLIQDASHHSSPPLSKHIYPAHMSDIHSTQIFGVNDTIGFERIWKPLERLMAQPWHHQLLALVAVDASLLQTSSRQLWRWPAVVGLQDLMGGEAKCQQKVASIWRFWIILNPLHSVTIFIHLHMDT